MVPTLFRVMSPAPELGLGAVPGGGTDRGKGAEVGASAGSRSGPGNRAMAKSGAMAGGVGRAGHRAGSWDRGWEQSRSRASSRVELCGTPSTPLNAFFSIFINLNKSMELGGLKSWPIKHKKISIKGYPQYFYTL